MQMTQQAIMTSTVKNSDIPAWLVPTAEPEIPLSDIGKSNAQLRRERQEKTFEVMFDRMLLKLEQGVNLKEILRDDSRDIDYEQLRRWIMKDPHRKAKYYEAQELGTEIMAAEILEIADAVDNMEDVQRSKVRIEARQFLIKTWNRKRYGDVKTLEVNQSISITAALEQANARLISGITIDHEDND